ncbi:MAG: TIGR04255 family protein, partial [Solirubrobacteraceae bacterium]
GAQQPLRMLDRARTESVVIGAETIVVENTSYRCYEDFCELLREVLSAASIHEIAGFTRIGLRYINEIRIPDVVAPSDWEGLVHPALLAGGGLCHQDVSVQRLSGEIEYATSTRHSVVMRYGSFQGRVVNLEGPLRTRTSESGPAFLIDLDSYWEDPARIELPEFSIQEIMSTTSELRAPIHELFEVAITDELRKRFREEPT